MDKAPPIIFSRSVGAAKWARARHRQKAADAARFMRDDMTDDMAERIAFMRLQPGRSLIIGDGAAHLPALLQQGGSQVEIGVLGEFDEESPGPAGRYDLIVHLMGLGMINDLPGALVHARNALADGGLFLAAFPGAGSLPTLRDIALAADGERAAPRMHPLIDNQAAAALLQRAGFKRQVVDSHRLTVRYSALSRLVDDLRDHGLTRSLRTPSPPFTREGYARAQMAFDARRGPDGKVSEFFEILTLTGWKS